MSAAKEAITPTGQRVVVGQVWADNDWRSLGRTVRILEIDVSRVTVEVLTERGGEKPSKRRRTRILINRLRPNSTGYRLVSEPTIADGKS